MGSRTMIPNEVDDHQQVCGFKNYWMDSLEMWYQHSCPHWGEL